MFRKRGFLSCVSCLLFGAKVYNRGRWCCLMTWSWWNDLSIFGKNVQIFWYNVKKLVEICCAALFYGYKIFIILLRLLLLPPPSQKPYSNALPLIFYIDFGIFTPFDSCRITCYLYSDYLCNSNCKEISIKRSSILCF